MKPLAANPSRSPNPSLSDEVEMLSAWMEPRHTLLLRTLIDGVDGPIQLPGTAVGLGKIAGVMEDLRRDTRLKFREFREKWTSRLDSKALLPFLQRNEWIVPHPDGGVSLAGKGMRKESRTLYLQTLHDMASDCARQWASLAGRLQALQEKFASEWLLELPPENGYRVPPVLESALRAAELQAWKSLRLSLGSMAEEAFVNAMGRWEDRRFVNAEVLVREILTPWRKLDSSGNGFIGFMLALCGLTEQLGLAMLDHYDHKWELFFRGFSGPVSGQLERVNDV